MKLIRYSKYIAGGLITLIAGSTLGCSQPKQEAIAKQSDSYRIEVPGKTIHLPVGDWKPMRSDTGYAENFESVRKKERHAFPQVLTVFQLPMSVDRRMGIKISDTEYLEALVLHPETVTIQVRVDKGSYWVMSRETFRVSSQVFGSNPTLTDQQTRSAWMTLQNEVDETRSTINMLF